MISYFEPYSAYFLTQRCWAQRTAGILLQSRRSDRTITTLEQSQLLLLEVCTPLSKGVVTSIPTSHWTVTSCCTSSGPCRLPQSHVCFGAHGVLAESLEAVLQRFSNSSDVIFQFKSWWRKGKGINTIPRITPERSKIFFKKNPNMYTVM